MRVAGLLERSSRLQNKVSSLRRQAQVNTVTSSALDSARNETRHSSAQYAHADVVAAGVQVSSL